MHMGKRGTCVSYASIETLHAVDNNTTQNTNPGTHLHTAAPDTTIHMILCKKHTCTWGEGGTRVSHASTETLHAVDSNATRNTKADTHVLPEAPDTTKHIIMCEKHTCTWGERGTRVSYASTETLHGVDSNTTQNTNPDPHTYSLQRRTRRPTSVYAKSTHAHGGNGARA